MVVVVRASGAADFNNKQLGDVMVDNAIKPAIRTALRFHEIGNDTPYRISFAGKGKSGGSFGFMQGDLAAGQPDVTRTFRDVMSAAGMSAQKINDLLALLSKHQIKNPLTPADTEAVNGALRASQVLVDAMDDQILQGVYRDLDRCDARAAAHHRSIDTKAMVYMALWINMSGPPTKLLTWLDGDDPHLARQVPPAGPVVGGEDMEDYLAATNYYVENPQNLQHLHACAARGMQALNGAGAAAGSPLVVTMAATGTAPAGLILAQAAAPVDAVTIAAKSSDGRDYTVSIRKTSHNSGTIGLGEAGGAPASYDVTDIKARADGMRLVCRGPLGTTIACALRAGRGSTSDNIEIAVTGPFGIGNNISVYTTDHPDFERLKVFIMQAGFPVIPPTSDTPRTETVFTAALAAETMVQSNGGSVEAILAAAAPPLTSDASSSSAFAQRAVETAISEWDRFEHQSYNLQGQTTHTGRKEGEDPWYKRIGDYWKNGVNDSTLDGRDDVPWSAAFISWVMRTAGANGRFNYSPQHSVYISRAIRDLKRANTDAGYWCYRLHAERPSPGDIVCWARQPGIDYDNQNGGDYKGHCDVVVSVGDDHVEIIGGNVGNSVTRRPLKLLEDGTIKPIVQHGENLFGLMKCRL